MTPADVTFALWAGPFLLAVTVALQAVARGLAWLDGRTRRGLGE